MIARLDGADIYSDFQRYLSLVRGGIAGFIIFGGRLDKAREGIRGLQAEAKLPLVIASDLERGLGQQLVGGTEFPPAMALGRAWERDPDPVLRSFETVADEAAYAGINTVFAPVLDIDLNPSNPIISTRAFGREPAAVSTIATSMIRVFMQRGLTPCGKHFPGHGDTSIDSHISLPTLDKSEEDLMKGELVPFRAAIRAGLPMMMTGHLNVPSLDPSGTPVTLSRPALDYLRRTMGFKGLITTDAMNMGAISEYGEARASLLALESGADILLHPGNPEALSLKISGKCDLECRLDTFRQGLSREPSDNMPEADPSLVDRLSALAIRKDGRPARFDNPYVIVLTDEEEKNSPGAIELARLLGTEAIIVDSDMKLPLRKGRPMILTVSSGVRAYKGGSANWIKAALERLARDAAVIVSFSGPNLIEDIKADAVKVYAYWDSASSGRAVFNEVLVNAGP
jgi:beta-glucosidase-like glycosyl hydrolase